MICGRSERPTPPFRTAGRSVRRKLLPRCPGGAGRSPPPSGAPLAAMQAACPHLLRPPFPAGAGAVPCRAPAPRCRQRPPSAASVPRAAAGSLLCVCLSKRDPAAGRCLPPAGVAVAKVMPTRQPRAEADDLSFTLGGSCPGAVPGSRRPRVARQNAVVAAAARPPRHVPEETAAATAPEGRREPPGLCPRRRWRLGRHKPQPSLPDPALP